jgi:hypothetical protein
MKKFFMTILMAVFLFACGNKYPKDTVIEKKETAVLSDDKKHIMRSCYISFYDNEFIEKQRQVPPEMFDQIKIGDIISPIDFSKKNVNVEKINEGDYSKND